MCFTALCVPFCLIVMHVLFYCYVAYVVPLFTMLSYCIVISSLVLFTMEVYYTQDSIHNC
jgi:hypothetical protein